MVVLPGMAIRKDPACNLIVTGEEKITGGSMGGFRMKRVISLLMGSSLYLVLSLKQRHALLVSLAESHPLFFGKRIRR
ncbi:MAG: hypothetical protein K8I29_06160 [Alphaproteobacteria bacterium]|uniref:Uncharacterized protein n=1 Tax=Candidatus Nitrobium versatile TaxID=2884831 RepID=A0A953J700_9BACT|nr:hypothetical protein [Candidatus Nitrobium versatile]